MKKFLLITIFLFTVGLAATAPFQLFVSGNRMKVHPIIVNDRIYLPLEETARIFNQKVNVDLNSNRIVLEPAAEEQAAMSPVQSNGPEPIILGDIVYTVEKNVTKPLGRIKVKLFKRSSGSDDSEEQRALELWVKNGDSRFLDAHGLISETMTNAGGQFSFSKVPPGNYEVVAITSISPTELGYWWVPFKLMPGETEKIHLDLRDAYRLPLLKK